MEKSAKGSPARRCAAPRPPGKASGGLPAAVASHGYIVEASGLCARLPKNTFLHSDFLGLRWGFAENDSARRGAGAARKTIGVITGLVPTWIIASCPRVIRSDI